MGLGAVDRSALYQGWAGMPAPTFPGKEGPAAVTRILMISSLDSCNVLYAGLPLERSWKLQLIQNTSAHVLVEASIGDHSTFILRDLC